MTRRMVTAFVAALILALAAGSAVAECTQARNDQARDLYSQAKAADQPDRKAQLLTQSLEACPSFPASFMLGRVYLQQNRLKAADGSLRQALNLAAGPKLAAKALAHLGLVYEAQGDLDSALIYLRKSYDEHPYPKVIAKAKEVEAKLEAQGMTAERIVRALTNPAGRSIGVEPSVNIRVSFDYDSDKINAQGLPLARELGQAMTNAAFAGKPFTLVGHTDKRGKPGYNQQLSLKRAKSVKAFLVNNYGLDPSQIRVEGQGESQLLYQGDTEQDHAFNRRVEVRLD